MACLDKLETHPDFPRGCYDDFFEPLTLSAIKKLKKKKKKKDKKIRL